MTTTHEFSPTSGKIKELREILPIADKARKNGRVLVTTNGAFDILHAGHILNLEEAKSY